MSKNDVAIKYQNFRAIFLHVYLHDVSARQYHQLSHVVGLPPCVTAVLRSIPKEAFADSFQKLYERCQPCVVKDDDYFEGQ
jgi:hypothetical protein